VVNIYAFHKYPNILVYQHIPQLLLSSLGTQK